MDRQSVSSTKLTRDSLMKFLRSLKWNSSIRLLVNFMERADNPVKRLNSNVELCALCTKKRNIIAANPGYFAYICDATNE